MEFVFPLGGFISFLSYFVAAILLTLAFQWIYLKVTPYDEVGLIRQNNVSAAITYSGAFIGFVLPLASVIANSLSLLDMLVWGIIAGIVQLATFFIFRLFYPGIAESVQAGQLAKPLKLAFVSVGIGLLNAASMTY